MVSKKAIQNKLKRKIQKSQERTRQLEFKAMVDRDNAPNYIKHYSTEIPLGEERICRTGYIETRFKNGDPSVFLVDIRKFVKRRRKVKEGDDLYRPVFKQGIIFRPESWNDVYEQLTEFTFENLAPDDRVILIRYMANKWSEKYKDEYHEALYPLEKTLAKAQMQKTIDSMVKMPEPKRENVIRPSLKDQVVKNTKSKISIASKPKSNEDTNWHHLKKQKGKDVDLETKAWIEKNL